jgi:hypothetical protein
MVNTLAKLFLNRRYQSLKAAQFNIEKAQERAFSANQRYWPARSLDHLIFETPATDASNLKNVINGLAPKDLEFIGLTSGTTAHRCKQVPITHDQAAVFKNFQMSVASVVIRNSPMRPFTDERLSWGTAPVLEHREDGVPMGYISGYISQKGPKFLRKKSFPSTETNLIADMDLKLRKLFDETALRDIRCLAGVPSYILNVLTHFNEWSQAEYGHDLAQMWPNLHTCVYSSAPIDPFRNQINALAGREITFFGTYIATEGPFGLEIPELNGFESGLHSLNVEDIVFGFEEVGTGRRMRFSDLKEGDEVEVLVSAPNGLYQYKPGDVLRVAQVKPTPLFQILGRSGQMVNIAAEKATDVQIKKAMDFAKQQIGDIEHFFVFPRFPIGERPHYQWVVLSDSAQMNMGRLAELLDKGLGETNGDYLEARHDTRVLGAPKAIVLSPEVMVRHFKANSHRGQLKPRHIFDSEEAFAKLLSDLQISMPTLTQKQNVITEVSL